MEPQVEQYFNTPDLEIDTDSPDAVILYRGHNGKADYTKCHVLPKSNEKSLLPFLDSLSIDDDAKMEAENIFQRMPPDAKKGKRTKKIALYCLFKAYTALNRPKDPKVVAEMVQVPFTEMNRAFSMCSNNGSTLPTAVFHSPLSFLPQYAQMIGLDESCFSSLMEFAEQILDKDDELKDNYPQVVAAALLQYYMKIHGASYPKDSFAKLVKRSELTISKMVKKIEETHNT